MTHIRTVQYERVKCPVCKLNIVQHWNKVQREDHSTIPTTETGSAVGNHVYAEVHKPLESFNPYTSVFYCDDCGSILHHTVTKKVDRPEDSREITLVWALNQVSKPS